MNTLSFLVVMPLGQPLEKIFSAENLPPFGPVQLGFAAQLAKQLTMSTSVRVFPELVALGFWLRPANLKRIINTFCTSQNNRFHLPRGLVFHVAPSNVDTIFVYSWFISLLCGNRNIIRLSSKETPQTIALLGILGELMSKDEWHEIANRTLFVRYGHDAEVSKMLSNVCDVRVIWGGDNTINTFRDFSLNPRATELAFANKFSLSVLSSRAVIDASIEELQRLATNFHNDVYWFGQMACSSPRMVLWLGKDSDTEIAKELFWSALEAELNQRGVSIAAADNMNKEVTIDALAIECADVKINTVDPRITRVWMNKLSLEEQFHCGAGMFHEARIETLDGLLPILSRKIQTLSYFGVSNQAWGDFIQRKVPMGIDRIVQVGQALDFESVWDGQDMIQSFLRQVTVR
jgi:hypothetical protein